MSAVIVPYVPPGYDDGEPRLMVECLECGIEWGWTLESSEYAKHLPSMAVEHNARYHAREANVAKTMAEVLAEHQYDRERAVCSCSDFVQVGLKCDPQTHPEHVEAALSAAGYGLVADAKREALEEAGQREMSTGARIRQLLDETRTDK